MPRFLRFVVGPLLLLAALARAEEASLAARFPADTFLYVEGDAGALDRGLRQLDLVRLVTDAKYRAFFAPLLSKVGATGEDPIASLYKKFHLDAWLKGRAAIGLRGATFRMRGADGSSTDIRLSPENPLSARLVNQLIGMQMLFQQGRENLGVTVHLDLMAVVEPSGPVQGFLQQMLEHPPAGFEVESKELEGRKLLLVKTPSFTEDFFTFDSSVWLDTSGPVWVMATNPDLMAAAPRSTLESAARFQKVRGRMTSGERVLFAYFDIASMLSMVRPLVPPILLEELELSGLGAVQGLGFGMSMVEGGVRESLGLVFDGAPQGFLKILGAASGGLSTLDVAGADTTAYFGMKFDLAGLVRLWREGAGSFLPGTESLLEDALQEQFAAIGVDFRQEVLPSLGDEAALVMGQPLGGIIPMPQWSLFVRLRDDAKFAALVDKLKQLVPGSVAQVSPVEIGDGGSSGLQVLSGLPMLPPVFAVRKGYWLGGSDLEYLKKTVAAVDDGSRKVLRKDSPVFAQVMRGMGGRPEEFAILSFTDLRALAPLAASQLLMLVPPGIVDIGHMPDLVQMAELLSGIGFGLRNSADGITIETFSPTGLMTIGGALGAVQSRRMPRRQRRESGPVAPVEPATGDRPFLGLSSARDNGAGVVVDGVTPKGPADTAGLQTGDVIIGIDDTDVKSIADIEAFLAGKKPGDTVSITIMRGETMMLYGLKLGAR